MERHENESRKVRDRLFASRISLSRLVMKSLIVMLGT